MVEKQPISWNSVFFQGRLPRQPGFTLIEMSMVLVVVGILLSVMASIYPGLINSANRKKDLARLEQVDSALVGYTLAYAHLPCPDADQDGLENREEHSGVCTAPAGQVPFRTLGLSSDRDAYGRSMRYSVYIGNDHNADLTNEKANRLGEFCLLLRNAQKASYHAAYTHIAALLGILPEAQNRAFVVVSGGATDADKVNGFWDGENLPSEVGFDHPMKQNSPTYDDMIVTRSFADLTNQLECGKVIHGAELDIITHPALPSGVVGTTYQADILASQEGQYRWCYQGNLPPGLTSHNPEAFSSDCMQRDSSTWATLEKLHFSGVPALGTAGVYSLRVFLQDDRIPDSHRGDSFTSRLFSLTVQP